MDVLLGVDVEKLISEKAEEIYSKVCVELIQRNDLHSRAIGICNKLCEIRISEEKEKDPLLSYERTWRDIKKQLKSMEGL